ncbi:glycosyltransferase [Niabella yanshanensis]|uniref:Glycosyltransferase n=1 Tax=Niabella yanshanensis TaxID=577386 RepID=A0ABZ0WC95_9BACT|nr:glycosyltransferase [Niabella yanshanensis]WQD39930.1 glycosyltransferase [Niabella yanshanensis]
MGNSLVIIFADMFSTTAPLILILSLFVTVVLLFYYLFFFARLAFFKNKTVKVSSALPPLSTIVCAKNEQYNLEKNIPELLRQQYESPFELLLVNDNSEDDTKHVMQWMSRDYLQLKVINMERKNKESVGKKYPLSIGIREAKHEHLLLTDADCRPVSEQWAAKMASAYQPGIDIVLGYGPYEKQPGFLNKVIRFETFHAALQYLSYALAGHPYMGVGRNLSYKKDLFTQHKGFASINHIPGGDDDLFISKAANPNNTAIMIDTDAYTVSVPPKTWAAWKHQKTRHYSTSKYYKLKHKFFLGLYSLSQFLFYPLLITAAVVYSWSIALAILVIKSTIQYLIFSGAMKKLNEKDLVRWIFLMDLWMMVYYLMFANTLWKKEKKTW